MSYFTRRFLQKWDESAHPRGKTTPASNSGSFKPAGPAPLQGDLFENVFRSALGNRGPLSITGNIDRDLSVSGRRARDVLEYHADRRNLTRIVPVTGKHPSWDLGIVYSRRGYADVPNYVYYTDEAGRLVTESARDFVNTHAGKLDPIPDIAPDRVLADLVGFVNWPL